MNRADPLEFGAGWGDFVPKVMPSDLRIVSRMMRKFQTDNPSVCGAISGDLFKRQCSAGVDVFAVWMRAAMLETLLRLRPEMLTSHVNDGEFDEAVLQVAATISMKNIRTGTTHQGLPFDAEEFMRRLGA